MTKSHTNMLKLALIAIALTRGALAVSEGDPCSLKGRNSCKHVDHCMWVEKDGHHSSVNQHAGRNTEKGCHMIGVLDRDDVISTRHGKVTHGERAGLLQMNFHTSLSDMECHEAFTLHDCKILSRSGGGPTRCSWACPGEDEKGSPMCIDYNAGGRQWPSGGSCEKDEEEVAEEEVAVIEEKVAAVCPGGWIKLQMWLYSATCEQAEDATENAPWTVFLQVDGVTCQTFPNPEDDDIMVIASHSDEWYGISLTAYTGLPIVNPDNVISCDDCAKTCGDKAFSCDGASEGCNIASESADHKDFQYTTKFTGECVIANDATGRHNLNGISGDAIPGMSAAIGASDWSLKSTCLSEAPSCTLVNGQCTN